MNPNEWPGLTEHASPNLNKRVRIVSGAEMSVLLAYLRLQQQLVETTSHTIDTKLAHAVSWIITSRRVVLTFRER